MRVSNFGGYLRPFDRVWFKSGLFSFCDLFGRQKSIKSELNYGNFKTRARALAVPCEASVFSVQIQERKPADFLKNLSVAWPTEKTLH